MTAMPDRRRPDRYERRCRLLVRAYPRRWRREHEDELLGVLLDVAPPGAGRPDLRTAADVVRAGWSWRARHRPPLWRWLLWRLFERVPCDHRDWARDDVEGALFPLRSNAWTSWPVVTLMGVFALTSEDPRSFLLVFGTVLAGGFLGAALFGGADRNRARNRVDPEPTVAVQFARAPIGTTPRRRAVAGGWLTATWVGAALVAATVWWVAAGSQGAGQAAVGIALLAGSVPTATMALLAVSRLRSPGRLPNQPYRRATRPHGILVVLGLAGGAYLGLLAAVEAPWMSGFVAGAALAVLAVVPTLAALDVVGRWLLRRAPAACPAVRDVLVVAVGGRVPVDAPQPLWPEAGAGDGTPQARVLRAHRRR